MKVDTMHEFAITKSLLDIAVEQAQKHNAVRVTNISLVVGEMSGVEDECMRFYFDLLGKNTIAYGATLTIQRVPMTAHCRDCGTTFPLVDTGWLCPSCAGSNLEIISGRELYIDTMQLE